MFKRKNKDQKTLPKSKPVVSSTKAKTNQTTIDSNSLERFEMSHKVSNNAAGSTLLLLVTLTVVAFAGLFMALSSFWRFLNPDIEFSLPNLDVFGKIIADSNFTDVDRDFPNFEELPNVFSGLEIEEKFNEITRSASDFVQDIPKQDLLEQYAYICEKAESGSTSDAISEALQWDFIQRFPGFENHEAIADELVDGALALCPVEEESQ